MSLFYSLKSKDHSKKDRDVFQRMCDLNNSISKHIEGSSQRENAFYKKQRMQMRKLINEFLREDKLTSKDTILCEGRNTNFLFEHIVRTYLKREYL